MNDIEPDAAPEKTNNGPLRVDTSDAAKPSRYLLCASPRGISRKQQQTPRGWAPTPRSSAAHLILDDLDDDDDEDDEELDDEDDGDDTESDSDSYVPYTNKRSLVIASDSSSKRHLSTTAHFKRLLESTLQQQATEEAMGGDNGRAMLPSQKLAALAIAGASAPKEKHDRGDMILRALMTMEGRVGGKGMNGMVDHAADSERVAAIVMSGMRGGEGRKG